MSDVIAILVSDIHFSEKPPLARAEEPDWFEAMRRSLDEVNSLSDEHNAVVICGGDVFDKWYCRPRLLSFAISHLPYHFASIAGQHDLPNHLMSNISNSAFQTLMESETLEFIRGKRFEPFGFEDGKGNYAWRAWGFSFGEEIKKPPNNDKKNLLVAHQYVWHGEQKYPGAPVTQSAEAVNEMFAGYDVALLGDNHKSWKAKIGGCLVYNPGSFMRRRTDQKDHRPQVGLLKEDGSIEIHYLDISKDVLSETVDREKEDRLEELGERMDDFLQGLKGLGEEGLNFVDALNAYMDREGVDKGVRKVIADAMGE